MRLRRPGRSAQVGAEIAHAPSQAPAQQRPQGRAIGIADLGRDGVEVEATATEQRSRTFDAQVLEIGERGFAEHRFAAALQCAGAGRQRAGGILQREALLEMAARPASEAQDQGIRLRQVIGDDVGRLRGADVGEQVARGDGRSSGLAWRISQSARSRYPIAAPAVTPISVGTSMRDSSSRTAG